LKVLLTYGKRRVNTGSKYKEEECSLNARHTQLFGLCIYPYWVLNSCVQGKEFRKYPPHVAMSPTKNKTLKNTPKIYSFLRDVIFWSAMNYVP